MREKRSAGIRLRALVPLFVGALTLAAVAISQAAAPTQLISKTSGGDPANGNSYATVPCGISADGQVVLFQSNAANLPGGDGATVQAYVHTRDGSTRLVSKDAGGDPSESDVQAQGISANGRFVTFQSTGIGLPGSNSETQSWVYDLKKNRLSLISRANDGSVGDSASFDPVLSATGRFVAFVSSATNLPRGSTESPRVYVRDRKRHRTILASLTNRGKSAVGSLYGQVISSDGSRVTFYSRDAGLPGSDGLTQHTYVRDLDRHRTLLAERNRKGKVANDDGGNSSISGNGRFVIFESGATNLPGQTGNQIYVRDLKRGRTILAGRNSQGEPQDGYAEFAHLSGSGRHVVFVSDADNLPGGDEFDHSQVYVRDIRSGKTRLASKSTAGDVADSGASQGSISLDGRWAMFDTAANNLGGISLYENVFRVRTGF